MSVTPGPSGQTNPEINAAEGSGQEPPQAGLSSIELINDEARATIYRHGAHLTEWTPHGTGPVLWVSAHSAWKTDKPIRGGVPLCFPWFGPQPGDSSAPIHGWARVSEWQMLEGDERSVTMGLERDDWSLRYTVRPGRALQMELQITNAATITRRCDAALHTYFAVADVRRCTIHGLQGAVLLDKARGGQRRTEQEPHIEITAETDRIYYSEAAVEIRDVAAGRTIVVEKTGSGATVVWNPWQNKAAALPDFGDDEWQYVVCVETVNTLDSALSLPAGETHVMTASVSVRPLEMR